MLTSIRSIAAVALLTVSVACDDSRPSGKVSGKDVRDAYSDAARTTNAYVSQTRDEYVVKAQHDMDDIDAQLAKLRREANGAAADAKARIDASIANLEQQRARAGARLADLKDATGDAWKDMAKGLDRALDDLRTSAKNAADHFD